MADPTVESIAACGVVGAGGGGFPTHVKLKAKAEYVLLNAAECEPLLHKDKEILRHYGEQVIAGLKRAGELVGAKKTYIGIKGKYQDVIDALTPKLPSNMTISPLADSYPTGDEFILVHDVLGRIIPPGKIPLAVGAVVMNVESAYNVAGGVPVTEKFLTVAGAVEHPVTVKVPVGITFREAIAMAGGATVPEPNALVGGVMMGRLARNLDEPITKTTGGLIILNEDHYLIRRHKRPYKIASRIGHSACDQCGFCTQLCPRYLLGHPIEPHRAMRSLAFNMVGEANTIGTLFCCECNLCSMVSCPEDLDPKSVCADNKRRLMKAGTKWEVPANEERAKLNLEDRRTPVSRLIRKLGLSPFRNKGPLELKAYHPQRVVLPLKQHAGAPSKAVVAVGDTVQVGTLIAQPAEGALGANIHASIAGRVVAVNDAITIEAK